MATSKQIEQERVLPFFALTLVGTADGVALVEAGTPACLSTALAVPTDTVT
jgi:hypothetical protein